MTVKEIRWGNDHRDEILGLWFVNCAEHKGDGLSPWLIHVQPDTRQILFCPFHPERGRITKQIEVPFGPKAISKAISVQDFAT